MARDEMLLDEGEVGRRNTRKASDETPLTEQEVYEATQRAGEELGVDEETLAYEAGMAGDTSKMNKYSPAARAAFARGRTDKQKQTRETGDGTEPPYAAPEGTKWSFIGGEWKLYKLATATPDSPGGNNNNNNLPPANSQAAIDAAVAKALAASKAQSDALAAQLKAEKDAEKMAGKMKASDRLTALFTSYGLGSLASFINKRIMDDVSEEMVLVELYDQPEYKLRFPGMESLRGKKRTITEKEYMDIEKAMTQTARFFDLPKGFYDNPDDFGKLIGGEVSAKEYQDRLQVGQDLAREMNPAARAQLQEFYNVGEGGITAYVLDPDRALALIQKQSKAAQFVGFGRLSGFKLEGMNAAQAEQIAGTEAYAKLSAQQLQQALGQAAQLRQTQSRLTGIEGEVYDENQALQAVIEGSPEAILASQQRAQREGARFGGGAGVTGTSLRSTPGI
jgi:hypothetical protein